jgi:predicted enzyme related to lactoylglutathione lyase
MKRVAVPSREQGRVAGIGGIFFKARVPQALREWYRHHLGIPSKRVAAPFSGGSHTITLSAWGPPCEHLRARQQQLQPGPSPFMINFRAANLAALLAQLRADGCDVADMAEDSEYGKFGWVADSEGNRVELWEPPEGDQDLADHTHTQNFWKSHFGNVRVRGFSGRALVTYIGLLGR